MFAVSEELLTQVLCRLTDMLADEFCRLVSAVKTFTSAGAVTVRLQKHFIDSSFILAQVGFAEKKNPLLWSKRDEMVFVCSVLKRFFDKDPIKRMT